MILELYKDYEILDDVFGITVMYCGDEIVFGTIEEARAFIDEIER